MDDSDVIETKFYGSPELVDELVALMRQAPKQVRIVTSGITRDPTALQLEIGPVADVMTAIQFPYFVGTLATQLYRLLHKHKAQRIVVQTPDVRVVIVSTKDLTEEQVRETLKKLVEAIP